MTHKRHIYLSEDIDRKLVELAAHEGLSVSALIRRLIVLLHAKQIGAKNEAAE
jgi:predicted CopG family antitoxin